MAFAACPSHGPGVKMLRDWPIAKLIGKLRWYLGDVDDPAMTLALRQWCVWISIYPLSLCPMLGNSLCPAQAGSIWIRWGTCVSPETWRWGSWWIGAFWTWDGHSDFEATDFQRKDLRYSKIMFFLGQDSGKRIEEAWHAHWAQSLVKVGWLFGMSIVVRMCEVWCFPPQLL